MEEAQKKHSQFTAGGKTVDLFPATGQNCPVLYLNTFPGEGKAVLEALEEKKHTDFSLVAVSGLNWNHDMAPWDIPPIAKNDTPCTGGADDYLKLLTQEIIPQAEKAIPGIPSWRGLAGYSLAGLFALYAMYHTGLFSRIASISGSLWFPGFADYAILQEPEKWPEHLYLSLGEKESRTKNEYLKKVRGNTEKLAAYYKSKQIDIEFMLNPGNHFSENVKRSALGIEWLLSRQKGKWYQAQYSDEVRSCFKGFGTD